MWWLMFLLEFALIAAAVILIILVLLQKGKGGGLAGAGRRGRTERVRHQGRRPLYQDYDGRGRSLDCVMRDRGDGRAASGGRKSTECHTDYVTGTARFGTSAAIKRSIRRSRQLSRRPAANRPRQALRRTPAACPNRRTSRARVPASSGLFGVRRLIAAFHNAFQFRRPKRN